jgi:hypothetical protein
MPERIFIDADKLIKRSEELLHEAEKLFPTDITSTSLITAGYSHYKGIIVPIKYVSHKYLFEYYQLIFLKAFIVLFDKMYEERLCIITELCVRSLLTMGIEDAYILFDNSISKIDRKKYILVKVLVDYSSVETVSKDVFKNWFNALFNENVNFLNSVLGERDFKVISDLHESISKSDEEMFTKSLKDGRNLSNTIGINILDKYVKVNEMIRTNKYKRMKSGEAHTLHGNVFLIPQRLKQQKLEIHLFRIYSYLMISSSELIKKLSDYHKESKFKSNVDQHIEDYNKFRSLFASEWARIEKDK